MPEDRSFLHELESATLDELGHTTPIVVLNQSRLNETALRMATGHRLHGLAWTPETAWPALPSAVAALRAADVVGVCSPSIAGAWVAANAGFRAVTLKTPPVTGAGPRLVAKLAKHVEVTVIVDHFVQAERLSESCRQAGTSLDLLLRVDVGRERLGVRPGPDLHDLALGAGALPAVRLAGIAVEAASVASCGIAGLQPVELHRLLARCRRCLARAGLTPQVVSIHRIDDIAPEMPGVESHAAAPHAAAVATASRTPWPDSTETAIAIVAGVIGRPTRHAAIIDAGRPLLTERVSVVWPPDLRVESVTIEDDFGLLKLADGGRSLVIGDLVVLETASSIPLPTGPVLVHDGRRWWIERPVSSEIDR